MWLWRQRFVLLYFALSLAFLAKVAAFHDPRTGFTSLSVFGDRFAPMRIPELRDLPIYTYRDADGYDGQFYAQLAVAGNPLAPELLTALDSPAYRSRRVLLPALAYLAGLGRPSWVLAAYALSNVVTWLLLAWLTARWWFPPTSLDNLVRWIGTLFGAGMLVSVTRSLTDGPCLLFIALGMRSLELNRGRLAAGLLAAAGLVRESSVLAASAFLPALRSPRLVWLRASLAILASVLPAVIWTAILSVHYGTLSAGVLGWPGGWVPTELANLRSMMRAEGWLAAKDDFLVVVAVLTQVSVLVLRPRPAVAWWRVGVAFAVLVVFRGAEFWEGALTGVPRTVLPLTLAFNVLAPRTRGGLVLLLVGNVTVLSALTALDVVPTVQTTFADGITCEYASGWHDAEHLRRHTWTWAAESATMTFQNPLARSVLVELDFGLRSETNRAVSIHSGSVEQAIALEASHGRLVHFGPFELRPGSTSLAFDTSEPPWLEPGPHKRALSFSVEDLWLTPDLHR